MISDIDPSYILIKDQQFGDTVDKLAKEFESRFSECRANKSLFEFIIDPFSFSPDDI
jgi:hypothetical protein